MSRQQVLLTGFQGYGGRALNPAEEVVRRLDGSGIGGIRVQGQVLPVSYRELEPCIRQLIAETDPVAVICLGLYPGEPMIRLERVAVNIADFEIPDNAGLLKREAAVVTDGPVACAATLPLYPIRDRLLDHGIPVRLSGSAGQFLCNALMYLALRTCSERQPAPPCGFIHLPYLPAQVSDIIRLTRERAQLEVAQRGDLASMALETMVTGIQQVLEVTLEHSAR